LPFPSTTSFPTRKPSTGFLNFPVNSTTNNLSIPFGSPQHFVSVPTRASLVEVFYFPFTIYSFAQLTRGRIIAFIIKLGNPMSRRLMHGIRKGNALRGIFKDRVLKALVTAIIHRRSPFCSCETHDFPKQTSKQ